MGKLKEKLTKELVGVLLSGATALLLLANLFSGTLTSVPTKEMKLGGFDLYKTATSSRSTITTTSTLIIGTSTARSYLALVNDGTSDIYLMFGDRPAVAGQGVRLNAGGGSFEIDDNNLYKGAIRAITWSGTATTTVFEAY